MYKLSTIYGLIQQGSGYFILMILVSFFSVVGNYWGFLLSIHGDHRCHSVGFITRVCLHTVGFVIGVLPSSPRERSCIFLSTSHPGVSICVSEPCFLVVNVNV